MFRTQGEKPGLFFIFQKDYLVIYNALVTFTNAFFISDY